MPAAKRFYMVMPENLFTLQAKITYLQKRVIGSDLKIQVLGSVHTTTKRGIPKRYIVDVTGKTPTIEGHKVVAVIKHNAQLNLVNSVPGSGVELPAAYWTAKPICEHCGHKRSRSQTVILADPQGKLTQVGKNCLADFLRSDDWANHLAMMAELEQVLNESSSESMSMGRITYDVHHIIDRTVLALESLNVDWIGKSDRAALIRWATGRPEGITLKERKEDFQKLNDRFGHGVQNQTKIDQVHSFWNSANLNDLSSFQKNLLALFLKREISLKELNLAVWVALAILSETEEGRALRLKRQALAEEFLLRKAADAHLQHFGTVGARAIFRLKIVHTSTYESQFGTGFRICFKDENGNDAVWFTSSDKVQDLSKDKFYSFKATVKAHDTFNDKKQTILNRVSLEAQGEALYGA